MMLAWSDERFCLMSHPQDFVRTTTKYWVQDEDISQLKWFVLQHLPVLLQDGSGVKSDSQLVNSVYLDNATLELYKGRLDKTPGAIAVRFRWYGSGTPELVFVERKTHRESWTQEVSVKVRMHPSFCFPGADAEDSCTCTYHYEYTHRRSDLPSNLQKYP